MSAPRQDPTLQELCGLLLEKDLITDEALVRGKEIAREGHIRLPAVLTRLGLLSEKELAEVLAGLFQVRILGRGEILAVNEFPPEINLAYLKARRVLPVAWRDESVDLAMADPFDDSAVTAMEFAWRRTINRIVAEESDIEDALQMISAKRTLLQPTHSAPGGAQIATDLELLNDRDSDAPIIRLVSRLITKAVTLRASDIHVEPQVDALVIRFRIDGNLGEQETLSRRFSEPVVSRIKLMAKLDIAEKRLPQDGRIQTSVRGISVDLRIATFPTMHGESVVLRILGQQEVELDLDRVGLSVTGLAKLRTSLGQPNGLILITGPTGSGKTTTLYSALNSLRTPNAKLVTVEDPIEYTLPGISQLQVKQEIGLTFAAALRSVLRNDPDIIMVGEIRDKETADIAIRAALTGHLVLATLHTNTAAGAITRLLDLGVEDYLVASVLLLTSAQRLVRRLCDNCSDWVPLAADEVEQMQTHFGVGAANHFDKVRKARGCPACNGRGFDGRIPLFEAISITDSLRSKIHSSFDEDAFERAAVEEGTQTLLDDGLEHALRGLTTIEEVFSVVGT